jgi:hypothetical protein
MSLAAANATLNTRFQALPGLDASQVAWPNRAFTPTTGTTYYKVDLIPAGAEPELSGADHEHGIYQVSVFCPSGKGISSALTLAQAVVDHFKRQVFSGIGVFVPTIGPLVQEADWLQIPVSIPFQVL